MGQTVARFFLFSIVLMHAEVAHVHAALLLLYDLADTMPDLVRLRHWWVKGGNVGGYF